MSQDWLVLLGMGVLFLLLGFGTMIWGKNEERGYYDSMARRPDNREFLDHWPHRPQFEALKIGGWIAIALAAAMIITGGVLWLWS